MVGLPPGHRPTAPLGLTTMPWGPKLTAETYWPPLTSPPLPTPAGHLCSLRGPSLLPGTRGVTRSPFPTGGLSLSRTLFLTVSFLAATCLHIRGQLPGSLLCSALNVPTAPGTLPRSVLSKLDFVQLPSMDGSSPLSLTEDLLIHCYTPGTVSGQDALTTKPPALLDFHERRQMKY